MIGEKFSSVKPKPYRELRADHDIGGMTTPGQTPAQRVMHTSDAFFRKFIHLYLLASILLVLYSLTWDPASFYVSWVGIGSSLLAKMSLRKGKPILARWLFIGPFVMALAITPWIVNGVRTPLLLHLMMFLVLTGWLLGTRVMWCFSVAWSGMLFALWHAESYGWWSIPIDLRGIDTWLIALQFSLGMTSVMVSELIRNYRVDIQRESSWQYRLKNALEFNTLIIESSPMPIRVFDSQGQCIAVNEACAQLLGQERAYLLKQTFQETSNYSRFLAEECRRVLQTGLPTECEAQITTHDEKVLWVQAHLTPFELDDKRHLLVHVIDMTERYRATQELKQLAFHDGLTGLANRRLFWEHFQQTQLLCKRTHEWGAVLLLDLNRFKQLNDQHGHEAGDEMLKEVSRRLQQAMRASDVIARLGGDEFTLLAHSVGHTENQAASNVQKLCAKLHKALSQPYQLGAITHLGSASIGFALIDPKHTGNLEILLRQADEKMYMQKKHLHSATNTASKPVSMSS